MYEARKGVKADKGTHQEQNGICNSGLRGGPEGEVASMNVLQSLLVSAQDENHGVTGTKHQQHEKKSGFECNTGWRMSSLLWSTEQHSNSSRLVCFMSQNYAVRLQLLIRRPTHQKHEFCWRNPPCKVFWNYCHLDG